MKDHKEPDEKTAGHWNGVRAFGFPRRGSLADEIFKMDRHDQELLYKQMRRFKPAPRDDGAMMSALVAVFLAGMTVGAFAFAYKGDPTRIATNGIITTNEPPITALPIARQFDMRT
jgi:hypothetical protein